MTGINIPKSALVVLIGAMGTGKSTFCKKHFAEHQVVSSDLIRQQLSGDFEDQRYNDATFTILYAIVEERAKAGLTTIIDSTGSRGLIQRVYDIAKEQKRPLMAVQFPHLHPEEVTHERMKHRWHYLHAYHRQVTRIDETVLPKLYDHVKIEQVDDVYVTFAGNSGDDHILDPDKHYVVIPDLHGDIDALEYYLRDYPHHQYIFLGDLVDRGKSSRRTFYRVLGLLHAGRAHIVKSNHDKKLAHYFRKWQKDPDYMLELSVEDASGYVSTNPPTYDMKLAHGLKGTIDEFFTLEPIEMDRYAADFIDYYDNIAQYYLTMKDGGYTHFFVHAGINKHLAMGMCPRGSTDESAVVYKAPDSVDLLSEFVLDHLVDEQVMLHVGHTFTYHEYTVEESDFNPNHQIVWHDIGLGKREYDHLPMLMKL